MSAQAAKRDRQKYHSYGVDSNLTWKTANRERSLGCGLRAKRGEYAAELVETRENVGVVFRMRTRSIQYRTHAIWLQFDAVPGFVSKNDENVMRYHRYGRSRTTSSRKGHRMGSAARLLDWSKSHEC